MEANEVGKYNLITIKFARAEQPKFEERKGQGYIEFGEKNNYPEYLLSLYNESPKHGAIVKGKCTYIFGKGFEGVTQPANTKGETWNQVAKKCIMDDEIYGGYYLQIVYNLLGNITDVFHIEYHKVRTNKTQSRFYVKNKWDDTKEEKRTYHAYPGKGQPSCILFIKQYNPKGDVYPLPSYFQGMNYIDCDVQISRWILGNAKDGFAAGKFIQFFNGEPPTEEAKGELERGLKKKFSGSEGDRYTIAFSKPGEQAVNIQDLGNSLLTKEDFTPVNNLVQQEIFSSHLVTSPMLFGIKTEGQLGGRNEIQEAYEIFNNTYVNERQQAHEETFNKLFALVGINGSFKITPVEPLGFYLKDDLLLDVFPREYFMDKAGIDQKYYALPPARTQPAAGVPNTPATVGSDGQPIAAANDNIKNLTGRQHQQVMRIVKQFLAGKMVKAQAALMLKSGFGFTDEDVNTFLGVDELAFSDQENIDFALLEQFGQVGESKEQFEELSRKPANEVMYFSEVQQLSQLESNVINLIKKDKRITAEVIATTLNQDVKVVSKVMSDLENAGIVTVSSYKMGEDTIFEREATGVKVDAPKPTTTEILLRYSYDGPKDERNRPFCAKLMELNRLYSRSDIELISERLGYSVWDRRGGWLTLPSGEHRPYCRHQWFALTVIRKKS